jgi:hypothetical protein
MALKDTAWKYINWVLFLQMFLLGVEHALNQNKIFFGLMPLDNECSFSNASALTKDPAFELHFKNYMLTYFFRLQVYISFFSDTLEI